MDTPTRANLFGESPDPQQQLHYLKQAFSGFINAKQASEMQQLGRVICAVLGMTTEEQTKINDNIAKMNPVVSPLDNISSGIASFFWQYLA